MYLILLVDLIPLHMCSTHVMTLATQNLKMPAWMFQKVSVSVKLSPSAYMASSIASISH